MPGKYAKIILIFISLVLLSAIAGCGSAVPVTPSPSASPTVAATPTVPPNMKVIVDMFGRKLTVANPINRVLCSGPVEAALVYLIAPDKLVGLVAKYDGDTPLVPGQYADLPVVGGWYGAMVGNYETFMTYKPDIILEGKLENLPDRQSKFGSIPVVGDDTGADLLLNFQKCITFIGELLDAQDQAAALNKYYKETMDYVTKVVSQIPQSQKVRVYYAEGLEGLNTDPEGSFHTNLLDFCGGINVAEKVPLMPGYGMSQVSLENVLQWNPDMIILGRATPVGLYQTIMDDPDWQQLRAVQNNQVYVRPDNPFSIFDGPPCPAQILGMYWMVHLLYPDRTQDLDLNAKFKEFYANFFHYDLTDDEVTYLLDTQK